MAADLTYWPVSPPRASRSSSSLSLSLTGCNLTGENAPPSTGACHVHGGAVVHGGAEEGGSMACRTTIGECVFIVMQKSQEGGVKQRKTVLKLCRGDRSNLAVKCLPVLHCWAEQETEEDESGLLWIGEIGCGPWRLR